MSLHAALSALVAVAWLPLALRFKRGWTSRRNPVSLAICVTMLLLAYAHAMIALALCERVTWQFTTVALNVFGAVAAANLYVSFRWSDKRFKDARGSNTYSIPPTDTSATPRA